MEHYSVVIFLLAITIALSSIAPKTKIPYPILLLAAGIVVGFIPGFEFIPIDPEVIFLLFLPPLLYDAAYNISFKEFKTNIRTISMMAVSLVFITMLAIAFVAWFCIPDMTWPMAFVIGAILSPPDAAAAAGITKSLKLSHRTNTILEGESLINDASALTAYRVAVSVAVGGSFVMLDATLDFILSIAGGLIIGMVLSHTFLFVLKKVKLDSNAIMSLNLLLPFVAYLFAENLNVSGVLAVVTLGLVNASHTHKHQLVTENTKLRTKALWDALTYILSGLIFILIGLEFPQVLKNIPTHSVIPLVISAFAIFIIAMIIRFIIVFRHKFHLDKFISAINNNTPPRRHRWGSKKRNERAKDIKALNWKDALIISWSGMRGIVSLATALALPIYMTDGNLLPHRDSIIFLTVMTVIFMLTIQGLALPLLIKWLKVETEEIEEGTITIK